MKKLLCGCSLIVLLLQGQALAQDLNTNKESATVEQVLRAYEGAWSRHDAVAIASFYYEPAMRVSPKGPIVRETRAMQQAFFTGLLASMIDQGYSKSAWEQLEVRLLDANTAIASGVVARYKEDGSVFQRQAVTYGLWRTEKGWQIFLSATHAPPTALHFR